MTFNPNTNNKILSSCELKACAYDKCTGIYKTEICFFPTIFFNVFFSGGVQHGSVMEC